MNKTNHTYQTPSGALLGLTELPGARWYGRIWRRGNWREIACIDQDDTRILVSGPHVHGWVRPDEVHPDE